MISKLAAFEAVKNSLFAHDVDAQTVRYWLEAGEIILVDVRETAEYEQEYIAGSVLCPLSVFDPDLFPKITDKVVVLHCAIGKRSAAAAKQLINKGHSKIANLQRGIKAWKKSGGPTESQIVLPEKPKELAQLRELIPNGEDSLLKTLPKSGKRNPAGIHPGRILLEEFLSPLNISQARLSEELKVPVSRVNAIIRGRVAITINTGLRLSRFFCATDGFWLHLQVTHDLKKAKKLIGKKIRSDVRIHKPKIN